MKKQVCPFANLLARDLTIGDVAIAQQSESKLSLPSLNRNIALRNENNKFSMFNNQLEKWNK